MANGAVALPRTLGKRLGALPMALGLLIVFVVAYGLNHSWKATLGALFEAISNVSIPIPHITTLHPFGFIGSANARIEKWFADAQRYAEKGVVWGINNAVELPLLLAGTALALGIAVFDLGEWTADYVRKTVVAHGTARISPLLKTAAAAAQRVTARVENFVVPRIHALEAKVAQLARAATGVVAAPFPRIGRLERDVAGQAKRLTKVEKALAVGAGAVLTLAALKRLGLGWLKCRNVTRTGKALCGLNPSVLEALLLDAATLAVAMDLEQFAKEMQTVTDEAANLIHRWAT